MATSVVDFRPHDYGPPEWKKVLRQHRDSHGGNPFWLDMPIERATLLASDRVKHECDKRWGRVKLDLDTSTHVLAVRVLCDIMFLHRPNVVRHSRGDVTCYSCMLYEAPAPWPCRTFLAIERAKREKEEGEEAEGLGGDVRPGFFLPEGQDPDFDVDDHDVDDDYPVGEDVYR